MQDVEFIDGSTGEVLQTPPRPPVNRQVVSLKGLFARAAALQTGPDEGARGSVAFERDGSHLRAWWMGDCAHPRVVSLVELPDRGGVVRRSARMTVRCGKCEPCLQARRRRRQWQGYLETMAGAFRADPTGGDPDAHLVPGCRTWMVTLTFNADARLRVEALATTMRAEAERRCNEEGSPELLNLSAGDELGRRLARLTRKGPLPQAHGDEASERREMEARERRFGLRHDDPRRDRLHWLHRAAFRLGSDYIRRLRRSRPRSEGPVPLRQVIVVEGHKRDGFPHLHLLVHEQGVPLLKETLVRHWSRRRDGAPAGGEDPAAHLVELGRAKPVLVGGHKRLKGQKAIRQPLKRAAFYASKYSAKEGAIWRASKGYGRIDPSLLVEANDGEQVSEIRKVARCLNTAGEVADALDSVGLGHPSDDLEGD